MSVQPTRYQISNRKIRKLGLKRELFGRLRRRLSSFVWLLLSCAVPLSLSLLLLLLFRFATSSLHSHHKYVYFALLRLQFASSQYFFRSCLYRDPETLSYLLGPVISDDSLPCWSSKKHQTPPKSLLTHCLFFFCSLQLLFFFTIIIRYSSCFFVCFMHTNYKLEFNKKKLGILFLICVERQIKSCFTSFCLFHSISALFSILFVVASVLSRSRSALFLPINGSLFVKLSFFNVSDPTNILLSRGITRTIFTWSRARNIKNCNFIIKNIQPLCK